MSSQIPDGHDVEEIIVKNRKQGLVSIKLCPKAAFNDYLQARIDCLNSDEIEAAEEAFFFGLIHAVTVLETCVQILPAPDDKKVLRRFTKLVIDLAEERAQELES
jgi:hypothetical protein